MPILKRLISFLICCTLSIFVIVFGAYLIYEKVFLSIQTGQTIERIGLIERAKEPISFWIQVSMFSFFGTLIIIYGLFFLTSTLTLFSTGRDQDTEDT